MKIASYNENPKIYLWLTLDFRKSLCILRLQRVYWILCTTFNKLGHNLDHKKNGLLTGTNGLELKMLQ